MPDSPPNPPLVSAPPGVPAKAHPGGDALRPVEREQPEPRDDASPVPMWLVLVFAGVLLWGGWYLASYHGDWRGDVLDAGAKGPGIADAAGPPPDPLVWGERLYRQNCAVCHQARGQGVPGQYPPLAGSEWVAGPEHRLVRVLLHGMEGPLHVKGVNYQGVMPAFGPRLKDGQIAALLTYVRQAWGNTAPAVDPAAIAVARASARSRVRPWTVAELSALGPDPVPATQPR